VVEELALALYPLVEARTAMEAGLTAGEWRRFGEVVSRIHAAPPPAGMRTETFVPDGRELVPELVASLAAPAGAIARELAGLWREHRETIDALLRRTDAAGPRDVPRAPSTAAAGPLGTRTSTRCYPTTVGGAG
jgi:hypothetical protein